MLSSFHLTFCASSSDFKESKYFHFTFHEFFFLDFLLLSTSGTIPRFLFRFLNLPLICIMASSNSRSSEHTLKLLESKNLGSPIIPRMLRVLGIHLILLR